MPPMPSTRDGAVGPAQQRARMAAEGDVEFGSIVVEDQEGEAHRGVRLGVVGADGLVGPPQHVRRRIEVASGGPNGVAGHAGETGGFDALPADVADGDPPSPRTHLEEVVEVAADLAVVSAGQ